MNEEKPVQKNPMRRYIVLGLLPGVVQAGVVALFLSLNDSLLGQSIQILFVGLGINVVCALLLYKLLIQRMDKTFDVLLENERRLLRGQPLLEPLSEDNEFVIVDRAFHRAADTVKKADKNRQDFISMVSHDLRSPLTSLAAMLSVLDSGVLGELPEKAQRRVRSAQANVERLMHLADELLDIRKLEEGKMDVSIEPRGLLAIIEKASQSVEDLADKKSVKIERPDKDVSVMADENRLIQVLINLLSNAIKFSHRDGVVTIRIEESTDEVEVQVIDRGRGMSLQNRSAVFDRFRQTESGRSAGGSGLGLNIAKAIVEAHDGAIGFDSREDQGSTFWFRIPRTPPAN